MMSVHLDTRPAITSPANPSVKQVVKLRRRSHRDDQASMLIEGFREISRALDNAHPLESLFYCEERFQGDNNVALLERAAAAGATLVSCAPAAFDKMAYRDRPDGLLALAPPVRRTLPDIPLRDCPFLVVAEAIEKPGNLGTILRSADAANVDAVVVCDRCTDINNPNVVRASVGTLFTLPVVETSSEEALAWLRHHGVQTVAATPHASTLYVEADFSRPTAIIVGAEQYGLSTQWMNHADINVRIPMLGQADSLNVASATTLLLYEVVRQRMSA